MEALKNAPWPGNVRELRNAIERGAVLARGKPIRPEDLPDTVLKPRPLGRRTVDDRIAEIIDELASAPGAEKGTLFRSVEARWEKALIRRVLEGVGGNQVKA